MAQWRSSFRHFVRFARIYAAWKPYRMALVRDALEEGLTVVRPPFVHYAHDPGVLDLNYQFMVRP
jgi:alpha-glucosidase (family GH31 glycosyl hydrolase)